MRGVPEPAEEGPQPCKEGAGSLAQAVGDGGIPQGFLPMSAESREGLEDGVGGRE